MKQGGSKVFLAQDEIFFKEGIRKIRKHYCET
jgi:hypothetical protein